MYDQSVSVIDFPTLYGPALAVGDLEHSQRRRDITVGDPVRDSVQTLHESLRERTSVLGDRTRTRLDRPARCRRQSRTQLDALRSQLYALEAENRKLRDERPERATAIDIEEELEQAQEENIRLSQHISEICEAQKTEALASGAPEAEVEKLCEELAQLGEEAAVLRLECAAKSGELELTTQHCREQQVQLEL